MFVTQDSIVCSGITFVQFVGSIPTQGIICGKPMLISNMWAEEEPPQGFTTVFYATPERDQDASDTYGVQTQICSG